jgi:hypothetical protein
MENCQRRSYNNFGDGFWLILNPIDQNPCAHSRNPMDMIRQGLVDELVASLAAVIDDTDLLLGRILFVRRPADVLDNLLGRILRRKGVLSYLRSFERYDEPKTIPSSIQPFCLMRR